MHQLSLSHIFKEPIMMQIKVLMDFYDIGFRCDRTRIIVAPLYQGPEYIISNN